MSVVKINAIEVPEGMGSELEHRFAERARVVETMPGFEGFELLRPWTAIPATSCTPAGPTRSRSRTGCPVRRFRQGHARAESTDGRPVAAHASLLQFEVVLHLDGGGDG